MSAKNYIVVMAVVITISEYEQRHEKTSFRYAKTNAQISMFLTNFLSYQKFSVSADQLLKDSLAIWVQSSSPYLHARDVNTLHVSLK